MQRVNTLKQTGETPVMRQAASILWETLPPGGTFTVSKEGKKGTNHSERLNLILPPTSLVLACHLYFYL